MKYSNTSKFQSKVWKDDCYLKGQEFEKYIQDLFNREYFKIKRWRKSKAIPKDTFISDISLPDLELIYIGKKQYLFAVECKWRRSFYYNKIEWASPEQIEKYLEFEMKRAMPVFIVIGVGGLPSNPEKLFVTPLCNLANYPIVKEDQLIQHKRKPTRRFFYNTVQLKLF